ncbi:hypothetical protein A2U01_0035789, partial [Trifolium medium]|nr:hypothetical protein [Trifolium medium]
IHHVEVVGRTISPAFIVRMLRRGRCSLIYCPREHKEQGCDCWLKGML